MQSEAILPHPPWYRIYTRITDVVFLCGIIIEHASAFTRAAEHVQALEEEERQWDVLEFELIIDDDDDPYDDGVVRGTTAFLLTLRCLYIWTAVQRVYLKRTSYGRSSSRLVRRSFATQSPVAAY